MRLFTNLFKKPQRKTLDQCSDMALQKSGAEVLFGGYREPKPPIHEYERPKIDFMRATDLLSDVETEKQK